MLIGEPGPTQADLHFRLFGIPVRVHPAFWIVSLIIGAGALSGGKADPVEMLVWTGAVFVSILMHELGHAFTQRYYGGHPWITLYGMGGLAACNDCDRSPTSQIVISLAGPVAGFLFAALVILGIVATGRSIEPAVGGGLPMSLPWGRYITEPFASWGVNLLIMDLLWINIWWGILNLLPIYPLDGGHVAREVLTLGNPRRGIVGSLWLSVIAAAVMAGYGVLQQDVLFAFLFGYLAYSSYSTLQAYEDRMP